MWLTKENTFLPAENSLTLAYSEAIDFCAYFVLIGGLQAEVAVEEVTLSYSATGSSTASLVPVDFGKCSG